MQKESIKKSIMTVIGGLMGMPNTSPPPPQFILQRREEPEPVSAELNEAEIGILTAVQFHFDQNGEAPSHRELSAYTGRVRSDVARRLDSLESKGFIEKTDARSRNLKITRRIEVSGMSRPFNPEESP